jgi:hypothetical protein
MVVIQLCSRNNPEPGSMPLSWKRRPTTLKKVLVSVHQNPPPHLTFQPKGKTRPYWDWTGFFTMFSFTEKQTVNIPYISSEKLISASRDSNPRPPLDGMSEPLGYRSFWHHYITTLHVESMAVGAERFSRASGPPQGVLVTW